MTTHQNEHIRNSIIFLFELPLVPFSVSLIFYINYRIMGFNSYLIIPLTVLFLIWITILASLEDDVFKIKRKFKKETYEYTKNILMNIEYIKMNIWEKPIEYFIKEKRKREIQELFMSKIFLSLYYGIYLVCSRGILLFTVLFTSYFNELNLNIHDMFVILISLNVLQQTIFYSFFNRLSSFFKFIRWFRDVQSFLNREDYNQSVHDMIGSDESKDLFQVQTNEQFILDINNLNINHKSYANNLLTNISFTLSEGEQVFICGNSSSGKVGYLIYSQKSRYSKIMSFFLQRHFY